MREEARFGVRKPVLFKSSLPIQGLDDRLVLMFWATSREHRFRDVAWVERNGSIKWRAQLPGNAERDCFVCLNRNGDVYVARTYAGHVVAFDAEGRELELAGG